MENRLTQTINTITFREEYTILTHGITQQTSYHAQTTSTPYPYQQHSMESNIAYPEGAAGAHAFSANSQVPEQYAWPFSDPKQYKTVGDWAEDCYPGILQNGVGASLAPRYAERYIIRPSTPVELLHSRFMKDNKYLSDDEVEAKLSSGFSLLSPNRQRKKKRKIDINEEEAAHSYPTPPLPQAPDPSVLIERWDPYDQEHIDRWIRQNKEQIQNNHSSMRQTPVFNM